jgi:hypothetical protein
MRKFVLATLAALAIGTAAFAQPAEARCWWNGYSWHCWGGPRTPGGGVITILIGVITGGAMAPTGTMTTGIAD